MRDWLNVDWIAHLQVFIICNFYIFVFKNSTDNVCVYKIMFIKYSTLDWAVVLQQ